LKGGGIMGRHKSLEEIRSKKMTVRFKPSIMKKIKKIQETNKLNSVATTLEYIVKEWD
jgi:DNA polymerase III delta prime subunit